MATESENGQRYAPGPDTTWQKNAPSQILLDSIFAALAAVLVAIALSDTLERDLRPLQNWIKFFELIFLLSSFFLFAVSAEGTTTACDEKDVLKYVYYLFWYNCGVICLGIALAILIGAHFLTHVASVCERDLFHSWSVCRVQDLVFGLFVLLFFGFLWNWLRDGYWLIMGNTAKFNEYLAELRDERPPTRDPTRIMKIFYKIRNL